MQRLANLLQLLGGDRFILDQAEHKVFGRAAEKAGQQAAHGGALGPGAIDRGPERVGRAAVVVRNSASTRIVAATATPKAMICGIDRKNGPNTTYCPLNIEVAVRVSAPKIIWAII